MARVIKFRGKSIADETWVFGDLIQTPDNKTAIWPIESNTHIGIVEVYPESVGQYTNLLDRNKKEIYEGDIVRQEWEATLYNGLDEAFDASGTQTGPVVIRTQGVCICPCVSSNHATGDTVITKNKRISGYRCEVIGCLFDDPKMIERLIDE